MAKQFLKCNGQQATKGKKIDVLQAVYDFVQKSVVKDLQLPPTDTQTATAKDTGRVAGQGKGQAKGRGKGAGGGGDGDGGGSGGLVSKIHYEYGYWTKHRTCRLNDKADLILKIGYFSEEMSFIYTTMCICRDRRT